MLSNHDEMMCHQIVSTFDIEFDGNMPPHEEQTPVRNKYDG